MGGRGSISKFNKGNNGNTPRPQTVEDYLGPKGDPKSLDDVMTAANPHWLESATNKDGLYTHNCQRCIWAVELMRRGYDVEAMPRTADNTYAILDPALPHSFVNVGDPPLQFSAAIGNIWYKAKATDVKAEILKHPDGSRGALVMHGYKKGHVCNWEIVKGKVVIYDGQVGKKHTLTDLMKRGWSSFKVARMDNVAVTDLAKDFVKRRQS